jgi:hypothetical protein
MTDIYSREKLVVSLDVPYEKQSLRRFTEEALRDTLAKTNPTLLLNPISTGRTCGRTL